MPDAHSTYSYKAFLRAAAKFPRFCGESSGELSLDDACKREVAALFSVMNRKSDGMRNIVDGSNCTGKVDCARGPLGLLGEPQYSAFSQAFYEGFDTSDKLVENPDLVAEDGYTAMASAMWLWMTKQGTGPSPHSIMTGFYQPNSADLQAGHTAGFGSVMLLLSKDDCTAWQEKQTSISMQEQFVSYEQDLGLTPDTQNLGCKRMWADFAWGGSSNKMLYFVKGDWGTTICKAVGW